MTVDYHHKSYNHLKQYARDVARHMFERSGKRFTVRLNNLQNLDFTLQARQCYRGCHACCFNVLGECIGTIQSRSLFITDIPDEGDIARDLLDHYNRYCENNKRYC